MRLFFQLALIALCFGGVVYFLSNSHQRAQAYKKLFVILMFIIGVVALFFPAISDTIAQALGVGNGISLVTYGLIVAVIYLFLRLSIDRTRSHRQTAVLVRQVSILNRQIKDMSRKK